jgi:AcrR family transcriptional regulator
MEKSSRERILDATIEAIDRGGETSVRIIDVSEAAGVTQGLVTYHFRTRDLLIAEASTARFIATISEDIANIQQSLPSLQTADDLRGLIERMTKLLFLPERMAARRRRLNALGFAIQAEKAKDAITTVHTEVVDAFTAMVQHGQNIDIIRKDLDARSVSTLILAYTFGIVMTEFDSAPPADDDLLKVINTFVFTMLSPQ